MIERKDRGGSNTIEADFSARGFRSEPYTYSLHFVWLLCFDMLVKPIDILFLDNSFAKNII